MRKLILLGCTALLATAGLATVLVGAARGAEPEAGTLTIERGRATVTLDVRGNMLGRLANGAITVTDKTPNDAYLPNITGKRIAVQRRVTPNRVFVRGQGLRFRMLGGSYRIVIRAAGISLSAVGRGAVTIDGEPRFLGDDVGLYSLEAVDCALEPESCTPIPDEPIRLKLGQSGEEGPGQKGGSSIR
jgi:hypothetical protein